jgi:iron complex outermembrane recepter protein
LSKAKRDRATLPTQSRAQAVRYTVLAHAIGVAFLASNTADAQQATQELGTVTVTGIRRGIEAAISIKKDSTSIVEAISAEDIGKLPDSTVAESISRLPGVAVQRNKSTGKAQSVSVRGLPPDFAGGLLNGREQASTGDSRGLELDQFPAELLGSILIYKTPDATIIGQGISATINQRTIKPLDFAGRTFAASLRGSKTGISVGEGAETGKGDRASLSYVDQFANRTVGLAIGLTRFNEKGGGQQKFNAWGGWAADVDYKGSKVKVPGGFTADTEKLDLKRDGAMVLLQYKPNKNFETSLDIFTSSGSTTLKKTGLEGAIGGLSAGPYDPSGKITTATVSNGVATSGTIDEYKGVIRNHAEDGSDKLVAVGWNGKFSNIGGSAWGAALDLSQSKVKKDSQRFETTAGLPGNATKLDTISWSGYDGTNFDAVKYTTGLNYSDRNAVRLTDVMGWSGGVKSPQAGYLAFPKVTDTINQFRASASRDLELGPLNKVDLGINVTDRKKGRSTKEGRLVIIGGDPYGTAAVPGTGTSVAGTTGLPIVEFNPIGSLGTIYEQVEKLDKDIQKKTWTVNEKVTTAYAMGGLDGGFYRGNVGFQFVNTKQSSTGSNSSACTGNTVETCPPIIASGGTKYNDVLPSLNLAFDVASEQVVRLGLAKVIARPNMADMRSSLDFSYDNKVVNGKPIGYTGSGGSPDVKPFKASALDLSYEKYFGNKGYFSAALFAKKIDTYVLNVPRPFDFAPYIVGPVLGSTQGILTKPYNGDGGNIKGIELAVNVPFSLFAPALDGFGVQLNSSSTSSNLELPVSAFGVDGVDGKVLNIPLPGLSRRVSNLRVYYEKSGIQLQVAARKRSSFLGEISDFQDNKQLTFIRGETTVDLQAGYTFETGALKGLGFVAQANNLTNSKLRRFNGDPTAGDSETVKYGKTYIFGLSYKF